MTLRKRTTSLLLTGMMLLLHLYVSGQNYASKNVKIALFSSTPVEDIRAVSTNGSAVLASKTREIVVQVPIRTFEFDRKLMQEHFNENYMESEKYPLARFKGVIDQLIDFSKDGEYRITVTGNLLVHGVNKARVIPGKLIIKNTVIQILTEFMVPCIDHKIKIPTLIMTKVAEVIRIRLDGTLNQIK